MRYLIAGISCSDLWTVECHSTGNRQRSDHGSRRLRGNAISERYDVLRRSCRLMKLHNGEIMCLWIRHALFSVKRPLEGHQGPTEIAVQFLLEE